MTILIGRFIGLVRAIAPFIAGASRMPLRKFLPYDVLGAGPVGDDVLRARLRLLALVRPAHGVGLARAVRVRPGRRADRRRSSSWSGCSAARSCARGPRAWIAAQLEKPLLRPVAPYLRAGWQRVVRPVARAVARRPARFVWNRFTPGELGLEVTTLLALAAVGSFAFVLLGVRARGARPAARSTGIAFDIADRLYSEPVKDVVVVGHRARLVRRRRAARARRPRSGRRSRAPLPRRGRARRRRSCSTWLAVDIAKAAYDRPRPPGAARRDRGHGVSVGARGVRGRLGRVRGRARRAAAAASRRASPS